MIRKRKDGLWQARYNAGFDPVTGKPVRKSIYGKTQSEVRKKLTAIQKEIDSNMYIAPANMLMSKWCQIYLDKYTSHLKSSTIKSYRSTINMHIIPNLGNIKLQKLKNSQIQSTYKKLLDAGINTNSLRTIHACLHAILTRAVKCQLINTNPANDCVIPKYRKTELHTLQTDDIYRFINIIKGMREQNLFLFILFTGARRRQASGLTWNCVDLEKGVVRIEKQIGLTHSEPFKPTKNGKTRIIHPAPHIMQVLKNQQQLQQHWKQQLGDDYNNDKNLVFTYEDGSPLINNGYVQFKAVMKQLGLDGVRMHDLRHTYATISIMMGDDIKTVSQNLGHASSAFTLDVYGHVTQQMQQRSSANMENYIVSLGSKGHSGAPDQNMDISSTEDAEGLTGPKNPMK